MVPFLGPTLLMPLALKYSGRRDLKVISVLPRSYYVSSPPLYIHGIYPVEFEICFLSLYKKLHGKVLSRKGTIIWQTWQTSLLFFVNFILTMSMFTSRSFKCREKALFHIVCYFSYLFSLFIFCYFRLSQEPTTIETFDILKKTEQDISSCP